MLQRLDRVGRNWGKLGFEIVDVVFKRSYVKGLLRQLKFPPYKFVFKLLYLFVFLSDVFVYIIKLFQKAKTLSFEEA